MPPRFHLPPPDWPAPGQSVDLDGEEFHHLTRVLRVKPGETAEGLDGRGRTGRFVLESAGRNRASLRLESEALASPPSGPTLAVGWSKSARRDFLFEKAVELRAARVVFWRAARSQGEPPEAPKPAWTARLMAAAKQCGNPWLPEIVMVSGAASLVSFSDPATAKLLLWEDAARTRPVSHADLRPGCLAVIGPEGGLTDAEAGAFLDAGFAPVSLGPSVLRWETAALAFLSLALWASALPVSVEKGI